MITSSIHNPKSLAINKYTGFGKPPPPLPSEVANDRVFEINGKIVVSYLISHLSLNVCLLPRRSHVAGEENYVDQGRH